MSFNSLSNSSSITFDTVNNTLYAGVRTEETQLRDLLTKIQSEADGNVSQTDLLMFQQQVTQWTLMINIQSTITKQISDSLNGIIQKSS